MTEKITIGYARAKELMVQHKWRGRITLKEDLSIDSLVLFHPDQRNIYYVRRDAGAKLIKECQSFYRGETDDIAVFGLSDYHGTDDNLNLYKGETQYREAKALTLDELRAKDGEPVWVAYKGHGYWTIASPSLLSLTGNYGEGGIIVYDKKP